MDLFLDTPPIRSGGRSADRSSNNHRFLPTNSIGKLAWEGHRARTRQIFETLFQLRRSCGPPKIWPKYIQNLLKVDETNHRREKDKSHITRAQRMWRSTRKPSRRESEDPKHKSAQRKRLGERPAEDPEEPARKWSETFPGEQTWGERDKRRQPGCLPDPNNARCPNARE